MSLETRARITTMVGPFGVFLGSLALQTAEDQRTALPQIEQMGYGALWCGEAFHREAFAQAAIALAATRRLVVATGIANIWARDPTAMAAGTRTLSEAWPERFILGLGVSHPPLLGRRGLDYGRPLTAMRAYLEALEAAPYESPRPAREASVVLAALGPRMLELARRRSDGAFTFFCPVQHTSRARQALGPERFLAVEQAVVLESEPEPARARAEGHLRRYLRLDNYRANLQRLGWDQPDLEDAGSERLFESLIAWGGPEAVANRLREHLDAGADHVVVNLLTARPGEAPECPHSGATSRVVAPECGHSGLTPGDDRSYARRGVRVGPVGEAQWRAFLQFVAPRAIPGVEEVNEGAYRRTIRHRDRTGVLSVALARRGSALELTVQDLDGAALAAAERAVRRMLDLDADTAAIDSALAADPVLAPLVAARPGLRAPGAYDGWELAVRAVVGQQVSVAAASTLAGRVVVAAGTPLERPVGSLTLAFPLPAELASASLPGIGMPGRRVETLRALGRAIAASEIALDGSVDAGATQTALVALPGIGPWTAGYIAMRALGDPDAFPIGDVGLRRAAERLGLPGDTRALAQRAERWRPYRTYAVHHLWASLATTSGG